MLLSDLVFPMNNYLFDVLLGFLLYTPTTFSPSSLPQEEEGTR
jgi:hypothetical protein